LHKVHIFKLGSVMLGFLLVSGWLWLT